MKAIHRKRNGKVMCFGKSVQNVCDCATASFVSLQKYNVYLRFDASFSAIEFCIPVNKTQSFFGLKIS